MKTLEELKTVRFRLEALTCSSCITRIQNVLKKEPGVENAVVFFHSSNVKVRFDADRVSSDRLVRLIEKAGYSVLN